MSKRPLTYTFTGDLSSHDRCKRAWAYEKHIKFTPPEQVQAVFGNLYHSSLEWLAKSYRQHTLHGTPLPNSEDFRKVLLKFLRMLRAQGISSKVTTDDQIADIVLGKIYPTHTAGKPTTAMDPEFEKIISNAERTEVDLRAPVDLKKALPSWNPTTFRDHQVLHLRGIVDVVRSVYDKLQYDYTWEWDSTGKDGQAVAKTTTSRKGELELWDYKATSFDPTQALHYVNQMLTYAHIYERTHNVRPKRCILFFIGDHHPRRGKSSPRKFLVIEADDPKVNHASFQRTLEQVEEIQGTINTFEANPSSLKGGNVKDVLEKDVAEKQCIICMKRWDCKTFHDYNMKTAGKPSPYTDLMHLSTD